MAMCPFSANRVRKIESVLFPERQITKPKKRGIKVNIELKRQNGQANRSITLYKDSDTSLWHGQAKLIFSNELNRVKQTELAKHTWQITRYQLRSGNHADHL